MAKLSARQVAAIKDPGRYGDGDGLWLHVSKSGRKSWVLRYKRNGRAREMGLGPASLVSLAEARQKATEARRCLLEGLDPLQQREAAKAAARLEEAKAVTFKDAAERYIAAHEAAWRNPKHRQQWRNTLEQYAHPVLGQLPVGSVDTDLVMQVLEPVWATKPETAARVRGRIEAILDWARARGLREGENPARWRGHLQNLLPARRKVQRVKHHAALPYPEVPAFMARLREQPGISARALEFAILTAARTSEVLGATWDEIDLSAEVWALPAGRMKSGEAHRVPLSPRAVEILERMSQHGCEGYVFEGQRKGKPLSNMAFLMALRRMERGDLTAHGFRSSFRDWAAERTGYPREVAEKALAHAIPDAVEAAYRRGDLFEKRRRLMADWAEFCAQVPAQDQVADVVPLQAG